MKAPETKKRKSGEPSATSRRAPAKARAASRPVAEMPASLDNAGKSSRQRMKTPPTPARKPRKGTEEATASAPAESMHSDSAEMQKRPSTPSTMEQRLNRLKELQAELGKKNLTQREILRHIGCSFNTAATLQARLDALNGVPIVAEAVVSVAFIDAVKGLIISNVEAYRDSVEEKLRLIADAEKALDMALKLLQKIFKQQE